MPDPVLKARGLTKRFGTFTALHGVDLDLERGDVVGFLGQNGAGKSTTMKILTGYLAPTAGTASVGGHDLLADPLACRRQIGYLPEEVPLYLDMRVEAYLDHVARLKGVAPSARRREVIDALDAAHLGEVAGRLIKKLSKGNKQRVGLGQALIGRPPVLILDEPTSGFDPDQVANFRALVRGLAERHSILLSTHILAEVEATCRRVVVVHQGRSVLNAGIDELRQRTHGRVRLRLCLRAGGPAAAAERLRGLAWATVVVVDDAGLTVEIAEARRGDLVALAEAYGGVRELVEERRSLEDVFRELIAAPLAAVPAAAHSP